MYGGVLMVPGSRIRLNELSSPGLTALPIPEHNGGLVCILLKAMSLGKVLVQLAIGGASCCWGWCPGLCATDIQSLIFHVLSTTEVNDSK